MQSLTTPENLAGWLTLKIPVSVSPAKGFQEGAMLALLVWTLGDPNSSPHASEANTLIHWVFFQGHSFCPPLDFFNKSNCDNNQEWRYILNRAIRKLLPSS